MRLKVSQRTVDCGDFTRKFFAPLREFYVVKKAYNRRKIDVKPSKCRDFTQILTVFSLVCYNGRNIIAKASQRRYFTAFLRKFFLRKKARARAYARLYVDFTRIFALHRIFFAQKLAHFLLGCDIKTPVPTRTGSESRKTLFSFGLHLFFPSLPSSSFCLFLRGFFCRRVSSSRCSRRRWRGGGRRRRRRRRRCCSRGARVLAVEKRKVDLALNIRGESKGVQNDGGNFRPTQKTFNLFGPT